MDWGKFFQKVFGAFIAGGVASTAAIQPSTPEEAQQVALVGLVTAFIGGLFNWAKHRND